jgi:uncharacterized protein YdiU (UPF0061 family)
MVSRMSAKLGLSRTEEADRELADELLKRMAADKADFTITFRRLADFSTEPGAPNHEVRDLFIDRASFDAWALRYAERLRQEGSRDAERRLAMRRANPRFVLRNHLAEVAIAQAKAGDFSEVQRLLKVLEAPFDEQPESAAYAGFPPEWASSIEVSCSS